MMRSRLCFLTFFSLLLLVPGSGSDGEGTARAASVAEPVATASLTAQVGRVEQSSGEVSLLCDGRSRPAAAGDGVHMGDSIKAGSSGRARVVFVDGTVLSVSPGTEIEISEMVYEPDSGSYSSSIGLVSGEVRTLVGDAYDDGVSTFALQSPTARADLGVSDLLMRYTVDTETTEITTFSGAVRVSSIVDLVEREVRLKPGHRLSVSASRPPGDPRPLLRREFGQFLEGVDLSVSIARELAMAGRLLGKGSGLAMPAAGAAATRSSRDASDILDGSPVINNTGSIGIGF